MKPYYQDSLVTLYHGDCRELAPLMKADAVVTDPPYGARKAAWDYEWPEWVDSMLVGVAPVVAIMPGVMNLWRFGERFAGLRYRWTLSGRFPNPSRSPFGLCHWIPCVVYAADDVSLNVNRTDVSDIVPMHDQSPGHPTPKPLRFMTWVLEMVPAAQTILDPFAGSGTTLRAAKDLGRRSIGIEIDERYCEIAAKRMAQEVLFAERGAA